MYDLLRSDPVKYIKVALDFPILCEVVPEFKRYKNVAHWIHYTMDKYSAQMIEDLKLP